MVPAPTTAQTTTAFGTPDQEPWSYGTDFEALKLLRSSFPDCPLSARVAALAEISEEPEDPDLLQTQIVKTVPK